MRRAQINGNNPYCSCRGDTISYGPEKTNRKMDLRILCNLETSNDIVNGEFGRTVKESKYFQDKAKLVVNGKAQLNNLIKSTKDKSMTVALILIQGKKEKRKKKRTLFLFFISLLCFLRSASRVL